MTRTLALSAFLAAILLGCDRSDKQNAYEPCNAEGVVTLDGAALHSGMVTFVPRLTEAAGGHPGIASIDGVGAYKLGNAEHGRAKALRPGEYVVTVVSMDVDRSRGKPAPRLSIPTKYANSLESPLRITLKPGENKVDLSLVR